MHYDLSLQHLLQQRQENVPWGFSPFPLRNEILNVLEGKKQILFSIGNNHKPLQIQEESRVQPVEIKCVWKTHSEMQLKKKKWKNADVVRETEKPVYVRCKATNSNTLLVRIQNGTALEKQDLLVFYKVKHILMPLAEE